MKYRRLAFVVFASVLSVAHAQDEERRAPPIEIPDFSNLDEYIYEPKSTVKLGFRHLSGPKAQFSGQGIINAPEADLPGAGPNQAHYYHDGDVLPDARMTPRLDDSGNPMTDPATGAPAADPVNDGKTNSWSYNDARQIDSDHAPNGYISFHRYSADIIDSTTRSAKGRSSNGLDLSVSRDMGNLFGTKITWNLMAGMSVNDISARKIDRVAANIHTITDLYSLYGQNAPTAPYAAPSTPTTQTITNADGTTQTVSVDTTVLIGNEPAGTSDDKVHPASTTGDTDTVMNNWKVKGSYYTFRGGAELWVPITTRFRAGVSLGAAMVYSGTTYTVVQTLTPEIGPEISVPDSTSAYKLLPGYYADATLQFDLTEKAGFFAGAVFQSAGSYTQGIASTTAQSTALYKTKIDLSNQNGIRAGMSIRF